MADGVRQLSDFDIVEPRVTGSIFGAMMSGLAAGIVAAALIAFPFAPLVLLAGLALAFFPIGPLWVAIAWILVRQDTRSTWAYAAAGAATATGLPILLPAWMFLVGTANAGDAFGWLLFFMWFALSGAIGGAFAGRGIGSQLREQ